MGHTDGMTTETLAQLVRGRLDELGLGVREAARPYEPVLVAADISDLQLGKRVNITPAKVQALALALRVPVERVREAQHTSLTAQPLELPGRFNLLHPDLRIALTSVADYLLRLQQEVTPEPDTAAAGRSSRVGGSRRRGSQ